MTRRIVELRQPVKIGTSSFKDPANSAGRYIPSFSLYQTYRVDRNKVKQVCENLYQHLLEQADKRNLGDARFRIVTYTEDLVEFRNSNLNEYDNQERKYILITRDTLRSTRATVLVRFLTYGENLYIGLDTYVLGKLNVSAFLLKLISTLVIPSFVIVPLTFIPGINLSAWLVYLCIIGFNWQSLFQRIQQLGDLETALRLEFNRALDLGSFNLDDVLMFTKSTLYTTVKSVREVFEQEGLPVESLDSFVQSINTINISTGGGSLSMSGSSIGVDNTISSTTLQTEKK